MQFKEWFKHKLIVGGFPNVDKYKKLKESGFDIVINVSDEHNWNVLNCCKQNGLDYFFFPMNEFSNTYNIGLTSIYGALFILYEAEKQNKSVYIHCAAGANRSPTVVASYYYMRTGMHQIVEKNYDPDIEKMFVNNDTKQFNISDFTNDSDNLNIKDFHPGADIINTKPVTNNISNNRLLENIRTGMLPAQPKMEAFLKECNNAFIKYFDKNEQISLDTILINSKI